MSDKIYFGKFDKWLTEKNEELSWTGISVSAFLSILGYLFCYWMPEIVIFFGGDAISLINHESRMIFVKGFVSLILFFNIISAIRLLNKKT